MGIRKKARWVGHVLFYVLFLGQISFAATITVRTTADSGPGSLREAVNSAKDGDIINFANEIDGKPIVLTTSIPIVDRKLTIEGNGVDKTIISGNGKTRVLDISGGGLVTLRLISLIDGMADNGGGMVVNDSVTLYMDHFRILGNVATKYNGGGIDADCLGCRLYLSHGEIAFNLAYDSGGGVEVIGADTVSFYNVAVNNNTLFGQFSYGAGMEAWRSKSVTVQNSSFTANSSLGTRYGAGGGISIYGGTTADIAYTTIAENSCINEGGGLFQYGLGVDVNASTLVNNQAYDGAGVYHETKVNSSVGILSSLVAGNVSFNQSDIGGNEIISLGYNLLGSDEDLVLQRRLSDVIRENTSILRVKNNGGLTATVSLDPNSPAINAGDPNNLRPDQLGRPVMSGRRDIGAYEYGPTYFYADQDGDGFGDPIDYREGLPAPSGYVLNNLDNCPNTYNPDQLDLNENGIGDACEPTTPAMNVFYLATECAKVGSAFVLDVNTTGDGEIYAAYTGNPMTVEPPADLPDNRIRFTVPNAVAGNYAIFARIDAPDVASDSYWVRVNDGEWLKWYQQLITTGFEWKQVMNQTFALKAGLNKIDFAYREPNTKLEKIQVSMDVTPPTDGGGGSNYACAAAEIVYTDEFWLATSCAAVGGNFTVESDPQVPEITYAMYSGAASMTNPPADLPDNRVRYRVNNALAGAYYLFAYVLTPDGNSDSFWVRINDGNWIKWSQNLATELWRWKAVAGAPFSLVEGENTIDFAYREPNARIAGIHFDPNNELPLDSQRPPADGCGTNPGGGGTLEFWQEAECAQVGSRFELGADAGASNATYVVYTGASTTGSVPADIPDNYIRFTLEDATANRYRLFARVYCASGTEDSFYVRVNNGEWTPWMLGLTDGKFGWKEFATLPLLQAGRNTIDLAYREKNARLDKLYVTLNGSLPTEGGADAFNCN